MHLAAAQGGAAADVGSLDTGVEEVLRLLTIYCSWCTEHQHKIDETTAQRSGIMELLCPKCCRVTSINVRADGTIFVMAGTPLPPKKEKESEEGRGNE